MSQEQSANPTLPEVTQSIQVQAQSHPTEEIQQEQPSAAVQDENINYQEQEHQEVEQSLEQKQPEEQQQKQDEQQEQMPNQSNEENIQYGADEHLGQENYQENEGQEYYEGEQQYEQGQAEEEQNQQAQYEQGAQEEQQYEEQHEDQQAEEQAQFDQETYQQDGEYADNRQIQNQIQSHYKEGDYLYEEEPNQDQNAVMENQQEGALAQNYEEQEQQPQVQFTVDDLERRTETDSVLRGVIGSEMNFVGVEMTSQMDEPSTHENQVIHEPMIESVPAQVVVPQISVPQPQEIAHNPNIIQIIQSRPPIVNVKKQKIKESSVVSKEQMIEGIKMSQSVVIKSKKQVKRLQNAEMKSNKVVQTKVQNKQQMREYSQKINAPTPKSQPAPLLKQQDIRTNAELPKRIQLITEQKMNQALKKQQIDRINIQQQKQLVQLNVVKKETEIKKNQHHEGQQIEKKKKKKKKDKKQHHQINQKQETTVTNSNIQQPEHKHVQQPELKHTQQPELKHAEQPEIKLNSGDKPIQTLTSNIQPQNKLVNGSNGQTPIQPAANPKVEAEHSLIMESALDEDQLPPLTSLIVIKQAEKERVGSTYLLFLKYVHQYQRTVNYYKKVVMDVCIEIENRKNYKRQLMGIMVDYFQNYAKLNREYHQKCYKIQLFEQSLTPNPHANIKLQLKAGYDELIFLRKSIANQSQKMDVYINSTVLVNLNKIFNTYTITITAEQKKQIQRRQNHMREQKIFQKLFKKIDKNFNKGMEGKEKEDIYVTIAQFINRQKIHRESLRNYGRGLINLRQIFIRCQKEMFEHFQYVLNDFKTSQKTIYSVGRRHFNVIQDLTYSIKICTKFAQLCPLTDLDYIKYVLQLQSKKETNEFSNRHFEGYLDLIYFDKVVGNIRNLYKGAVNKIFPMDHHCDDLIHTISGNLVLFNRERDQCKDKFVIANINVKMMDQGYVEVDEIIKGIIFDDNRTVRLKMLDQDRAQELICFLNEKQENIVLPDEHR